jgi:flagellar hook-associated protein 1 FlgK
MSSLISALISSSNSLRVFERALTVVQNNVSNVDTPDYASQTLPITALPFDPSQGLSGGITAGETASARDEYAEEAVQNQQSLYGQANQTATDLDQIETLFSTSGDTGIPGALNQFFSAVSSWSVNPNDTTARQNVLNNAQSLAGAVNQTAAGLSQASNTVHQEITGTVGQINALAGQIAGLNQAQKDSGGVPDPSVDAQLHSALEQLSALVGITALRQDDGTYTVLAGGQVPLVMGSQEYDLQASSLNGVPIQGGQLGSLLTTQNQTIPSYTSHLNQLAQGIADDTNNVLASGVDSNGQPGAALFTYNNPDGSDAASTLAVTSITAGQLAGALPDAPGGNGNVLNLAALQNQPNSDLGNLSFTDFYGNLATTVGEQSSQATSDQQTQQQLLLQAQSLRSSISGVDLNQQAANLIEFQQAYQATAQLFTVLNSLTQTTINLIPSS